jgi:hypothetical protein
MITEFPQFKRLTLEDNEAVEAHTRAFPAYSDYNFTSLWAWDFDGTRELSILNGNLVIKFTDYLTRDPFLSFLGTNAPRLTARTLLEFSASIGLPPELHLMPESSTREMAPDDFSIVEDPANFDYVYLATDISTMNGGPYKGKRRAARAFEAEYADHSFSVIPLSDPAAQRAIRSITQSWLTLKDDAREQRGITHEMQALEKAFELASGRSLLVGILATNGAPTSFTLEEICNGRTSIAHFGKTARRITGENECLMREMASYLVQREVAYLNWEEDLGVESLRESKLSFRPVSFLRKFTITQLDAEEERPIVRSHSVKPAAHW